MAIINENNAQYFFKNGDKYEGNVKNGLFEGLGLFIYKYYNKFFVEGKYLKSKNSFIYEGEFKNGKFWGKG